MYLLHWALITFNLLLSIVAAGHALLYKRDSRAALGWIAVCLTIPLVGPLLYFLFGINRIRTRARKLHRQAPFRFSPGNDRPENPDPFASELPVPPALSEIVRISCAVTRRPMVAGNTVALLQNGEAAYPAMLSAIKNARRRLYLSTYLFETNRTGQQFIDALSRCVKRGVDVRVMLDGIGELYSFPRAGKLLNRSGVRAVRFLPPRLFPPAIHINLRNHRKMLVADGAVGFVGGMNIGDRHLAANQGNAKRVMDIHFYLTGPVATQIEQAFLEDWAFCTGEYTATDPVNVTAGGHSICRAIVDGPNEDFDKLATILVGVVSAARRRILIMTPYFVPSRELIAALRTAALRNVEVIVILPARNNLPFIQWATTNMLWELLQNGVRVHYQPPPFVHSKLFIVDDHYAQIGSANIDSRSLRLNFELVVEIYGEEVANILTPHFQKSLAHCHEVTLEEVDSRRLPIRVRDAFAWLFSPYL